MLFYSSRTFKNNLSHAWLMMLLTIVAPGHEDIVKATVWFVDPKLSAKGGKNITGSTPFMSTEQFAFKHTSLTFFSNVLICKICAIILWNSQSQRQNTNLYLGLLSSGFFRKVLFLNTMEFWNLQPMGKVSPTTAHYRTQRHRQLP